MALNMSRHDGYIMQTEKNIVQILGQIERARKNVGDRYAADLDCVVEELVLFQLEMSISCLLAHRDILASHVRYAARSTNHLLFR